jgi:hypothetical protein
MIPLSLCLLAASGTRSHTGQIQVFKIDRCDSRVVAFGDGPSRSASAATSDPL